MMFVSKKKYDRLQSRLTAAEHMKDEYFNHSVKKTGEIYKLNEKLFELENKLSAKETECEKLLKDNAELKVKYTETAHKNFELVEMLAEK